TALFQALFCGVGQAVQPLTSANHGAGNRERILAFWKMSLLTTIFLGIGFTVIGEILPLQITRLFMRATEKELLAAPAIFRQLFLVCIPLGINVLSVYFLQSILKERESLIIALARSVFISGALIFLLPLILGIQGVWLALPVAIMALLLVRKANKTEE
ncbi:MAG: hypothetical protein IJ214_13030, partial [Clostridia bacterium]|nr:hypothetical protein [Clostridia bacterium]